MHCKNLFFLILIFSINVFSFDEGFGLHLVVKKVPKKVILLKSTEESTQKCTQKSAQVKKD